MFFCKQKPAYEMRISEEFRRVLFRSYTAAPVAPSPAPPTSRSQSPLLLPLSSSNRSPFAAAVDPAACGAIDGGEGRVAPSVSDLFSVLAGQHDRTAARSEEHTSELQSLMRISYAVFCLKKKNNTN